MMNSTLRPRIALLTLALCTLQSTLARAATPITTTDLLKLSTISDVQMAPDGSFAVYTIRSIRTDEGDKYKTQTHLWRIDLNDPAAKPTPLTSGKRGGRSPQISPDSRTLAFVRAGEGKKPTPQVWLMPLTGPGEARQLTTLENGAGSPRWFPDGSALLVSSAIPFSKIDGSPPWDTERPRRQWMDTKSDSDTDADDDSKPKSGTNHDAKPDKGKPDGSREEIRRWLASNAKDKNPSVLNALRFKGEHELQGEDKAAHLFRIDIETGDSSQLTKGFYSFGGARISPDGTAIVATTSPHGPTNPDRILRSAVFLMDADGSNQHAILDSEDWTYGSPRFSRNGLGLYFTMTEAQDRWGRQSKLAVGLIRPDGSFDSIRRIARYWASSVRGLTITDTGLYFTSAVHGGVPLMHVNFQKHNPDALEQIVDAPKGVYAYDAVGQRVVAAITTVEHPSRLMLIDQRQTSRTLHDPNAKWLADKTLSLPSEHWLTRDDGTKVQYWIMKPAGIEPGQNYPTVLEMHGGPQAMWGPGERSMWHEFQLLCAWGYGIVYANPRGSSGYGYEHQSANYRDWGFGPMGDVLACLDEASSQNQWIDTDRLFMTGGSYAGYLTAFIVGNDHRFKAAVAQRGVYDLETFFGEGNAWILVPWAFGGYPWEPEVMEVLDRESPFTYVDKITTPLLIMHASQDQRTGVTQSEMMFRALKKLGREVEYVRYPDAGHDLSRSGDANQRMDRLMRIVEFFERYADNDHPAPAAPQTDKKDEEDDD